MQTIQELQSKIKSTRDLHSVVKTMKALAAVSIRQYERAVDALKGYNRTVQLSLHALWLTHPEIERALAREKEGQAAAVVFGSEQGMVGQFNDKAVSFAREQLSPFLEKDQLRFMLGVGTRVFPAIRSRFSLDAESMSLPGSVDAITDVVYRVLRVVEGWRTEGAGRIEVFYHRPVAGAAYRPQWLTLLPLDSAQFRLLREKPWPTKKIPLLTSSPQTIFSSVLGQFFFAALYRACAASLAAENASRLSAMQSAEKKIEEHLGELNSRLHRQRQSSITAELLDIVSGVEALSDGE
ncbi:MAG: F0F1 ATP synthase subunit gamma [Candidatus Omnitrophica bacterium]|nr:F0F1 ATP synthase subunit gamma [Candidatus Omnitrophota bacterium]